MYSQKDLKMIINRIVSTVGVTAFSIGLLPGCAVSGGFYAGCYQTMVRSNGWSPAAAKALCSCGEFYDIQGHSLEDSITICIHKLFQPPMQQEPKKMQRII